MQSSLVSLKPQFKRWLWNFTGQKPYASSQSISLTPQPSDKNALSPVPLGLNGRFWAGNLLTSNNDLECLSFSAAPMFTHCTGGHEVTYVFEIFAACLACGFSVVRYTTQTIQRSIKTSSLLGDKIASEWVSPPRAWLVGRCFYNDVSPGFYSKREMLWKPTTRSTTPTPTNTQAHMRCMCCCVSDCKRISQKMQCNIKFSCWQWRQ